MLPYRIVITNVHVHICGSLDRSKFLQLCIFSRHDSKYSVASASLNESCMGGGCSMFIIVRNSDLCRFQLAVFYLMI